MVAVASGILGIRYFDGWLKARRQAKEEKAHRDANLLIGYGTPLLPAHCSPDVSAHPYRDPDQCPDGILDSFRELDPEERFARFSFAVSDLRYHFHDVMFKAMARALDLKTLLRAIETEGLESAREWAAVWAIGLRNDPEDMVEIAAILERADNSEVVVSALRCAQFRGPENFALILAVVAVAEGRARFNQTDDDYEEVVIEEPAEDCAESDEECDADTDEDDEGSDDAATVPKDALAKQAGAKAANYAEVAIDMADELLRYWKVHYVDRLRDFVLNRTR